MSHRPHKCNDCGTEIASGARCGACQQKKDDEERRQQEERKKRQPANSASPTPLDNHPAPTAIMRPVRGRPRW